MDKFLFMSLVLYISSYLISLVKFNLFIHINSIYVFIKYNYIITVALIKLTDVTYFHY